MSIYISGSMAYDRIMDFPDSFSDCILPDKIHILNVCFLINRLEEKLGGCAGNIAYSLNLLGEKSTIVASAGQDFAKYEAVLAEWGLTAEGITRYDDEFTAGAYIITDSNNNQITAFNPGAMRHPATYTFKNMTANDIQVVAPTNLADMVNHPRICREKGARCIFDPGQQIPALTGAQLLEAINGSYMLICNDYEFEMICKATGKTLEELLEMTEYVITTLGEEGSRVQTEDSVRLVPAVKARKNTDPTGAGDAYRAGLLKGMSLGLSVVESARIGSTVASFCVEDYGTQTHTFTLDECRDRHEKAFGSRF
ncbi:MAG: Adenosine kinase [Desulfovibrio sp.]